VRRITPAQALTVALPLAVIAAPHCYSYDMAVAGAAFLIAAVLASTTALTADGVPAVPGNPAVAETAGG
jgi:hypothetical protein